MTILSSLFVFLIIFFFSIGIIIFLLYIFPIFFGAPYISTKREKIRKIFEIASLKEGDVLYDLGSGDGRIVIEAAKRYGVRAVGIELNPILVFLSRRKIKKLGLEKKAKVYCGNIFQKNFSDATIVVAYLLQPTNNILEKKLLSLRSGTRIISETFDFKKIPYIKSHPNNSSIKFYKIP